MKPSGAFGPLPVFFWLVLGLTAALSSALAQEYVFTKIVDSNDPVPNGTGALFGIYDPAPALDAGTVVFRNGIASLAPTSIWSVTNAGTFTKLVDLNTTVPEGTGKFSALILDFSAPGYPVLSAGTVIFAGRDSATSGYTGGLYSVPAAGGAITRIANRNVAVPAGSGNFDNGLQYFSVTSGKVAFNGVSSGGSLAGIYSASTHGTALTAVADSAHPAHPEFTFSIGNFGFPSLSERPSHSTAMAFSIRARVTTRSTLRRRAEDLYTSSRRPAWRRRPAIRRARFTLVLAARGLMDRLSSFAPMMRTRAVRISPGYSRSRKPAVRSQVWRTSTTRCLA